MKKDKYILGLNSVYHESSACIIKNGESVAFSEEERFNRIKHGKPAMVDNSDKLPMESIKYCLRKAKIKLADVDYIAYNFNPEKRLKFHENYKHAYEIIEGDFGTQKGENIFYKKNINVKDKLEKMGFAGEFFYLNHHDCHASGAYYSSGFENSAVLVIDGIGEYESTSFYDVKNGKFEKIKSINYPNSLGFLWEKLSKFIGFSAYDAAKTMGLSSYGNPEVYRKEFEQIVKVDGNGFFTIDDSIMQFRNENYAEIEKLFGLKKLDQPIKKIDKEYQKYIDLSASLQEITDKIVINLAKFLREKTGHNYLCMSGGVALNCVTNARIIYQNIFKDIYIHPLSNDAGGSIGAAYYLWTNILKQEKPKAFSHAYLGIEYSDKEILVALKKSKLKFEKINNAEKKSAQLLADGNIVAWFQGAMEVGPRALGHRSILGDPRNPAMLKTINKKVKFREEFRPLCPSVLEEDAGNWFELGENIPDAGKYMLAAFNANTKKKKLIPAVVHIDGTSRIQMVSKKYSPKYHKLISEFKKLTGVPILLNTSFNIQEPIVCSPQDAIDTFKKSKIDYLVMGDYLIKRQNYFKQFFQLLSFK